MPGEAVVGDGRVEENAIRAGGDAGLRGSGRDHGDCRSGVDGLVFEDGDRGGVRRAEDGCGGVRERNGEGFVAAVNGVVDDGHGDRFVARFAVGPGQRAGRGGVVRAGDRRAVGRGVLHRDSARGADRAAGGQRHGSAILGDRGGGSCEGDRACRSDDHALLVERVDCGRVERALVEPDLVHFAAIEIGGIRRAAGGIEGVLLEPRAGGSGEAALVDGCRESTRRGGNLTVYPKLHRASRAVVGECDVRPDAGFGRGSGDGVKRAALVDTGLEVAVVEAQRERAVLRAASLLVKHLRAGGRGIGVDPHAERVVGERAQEEDALVAVGAGRIAQVG